MINMDFYNLAEMRQSCRKYNPEKQVEKEKLDLIIDSSLLAPSACNAQPYKITVCKSETAKRVAQEVQGMGMNKFAADAPVIIVISEGSYNSTAALGSKVKGNDYRSIDIGILAAHITLAAASLGLDTCILGWLDDMKIRKICSLDSPVRLVITLGYAEENYPHRVKKRKPKSETVKFI